MRASAKKRLWVKAELACTSSFLPLFVRLVLFYLFLLGFLAVLRGFGFSSVLKGLFFRARAEESLNLLRPLPTLCLSRGVLPSCPAARLSPLSSRRKDFGSASARVLSRSSFKNFVRAASFREAVAPALSHYPLSFWRHSCRPPPLSFLDSRADLSEA